MTVFLLIRHGDNDMIAGRRLAGRIPGTSLNETGHHQASRLADQLADLPIRAIYSSPLERTRETARPLAEKLGMPVRTLDEVNEVDFGRWSGRSFDRLPEDPLWRAYNLFRSGTRTPGGEMSIEVQQRMVSVMEKIRQASGQEMVALFSHGDPIRTAIAHFLGLPLDFIHRLRIDLASVSAIDYGSDAVRVLYVNRTGTAGRAFF
ncbi:MAG: histidine phosphatase family protein [Desulfosarcina sp.]